MTTVNDTAHDLILSICISFDQARFYSRFFVKLFIQKYLVLNVKRKDTSRKKNNMLKNF